MMDFAKFDYFHSNITIFGISNPFLWEYVAGEKIELELFVDG